MFDQLNAHFQQPRPFSRYTADILWTDPHISQSMLKFHLNPETDAASRRPGAIGDMIAWMDHHLSFCGKAVCDLGCGPGLYAEKIAECGARVTGVDFSTSSLDHARKSADQAQLKIDYLRADYLDDGLPRNQDIVCLIYADLCALSAPQRQLLYKNVKAALKPGGCFFFDVFSISQYDLRQAQTMFAKNLMGGFWANGDYFGFSSTFLYDYLKLVLDRYLIVEPARTFEIFNWLQYFDVESLRSEMAAAGFNSVEIVDALTGKPWVEAAREIAVMARV